VKSRCGDVPVRIFPQYVRYERVHCGCRSPVSNLSRSVEWYQQVLELSEPDLEPVDGVVEFRVGPIWLQLGKEPNGDVRPLEPLNTDVVRGNLVAPSQHGEGRGLAEVQPSGPFPHSYLTHHVLGDGVQVTQLPLQRARFLYGGSADRVHKQSDGLAAR
jgi:hypothetical protein